MMAATICMEGSRDGTKLFGRVRNFSTRREQPSSLPTAAAMGKRYEVLPSTCIEKLYKPPNKLF